ncbi:hypothetical protein M8J75_006481 [Diaphorina citri]|nr:hypothetical protein M8J75_006481 [Diaphorina citri]
MALSAMTSEDHCSMECMSVQDPHIRAGVPPAGTWLCCMFCGWLRSNKSVHQASISVAMLLVMALLVGSPVIFLITSAPEDRSGCLQQDVDEGCGIGSSSYETCNTLSCETTSQKVLLDMNPTVEPCRDFYQYACDHFSVAEVQNEYYEPAQLSLTTLHKFIDAQLQDLLFKMYKILDELGGYLPPNAPSTELTHLVRRILQIYSSPLFDVYLDRSLLDPNETLSIYVDLPKRFVTSRHFMETNEFPESVSDFEYFNLFERKKRNNEESRAYLHIKGRIEELKLILMEKILESFLPATLTPTERKEEKTQILSFASTLSKVIPRDKETFHKLSSDIADYTFDTASLQQIFDHVNWDSLFTDLFHVNSTNATVFVMSPSYLINLNLMLTRFDPRHIHNGILLVYATDILYVLANSTAYTKNKESYCTKITGMILGEPVNALYASQFKQEFLRHQNAKINKLFQGLKSTLLGRINDLNWLDNTTKLFITNKLTHLNIQVINLEFSQEHIEELLKNLYVQDHNFLGNVITRFKLARKFNESNHLSVRWSYPFLLNAFYEVTLNTIVIPLALIVQPYLRSDIPRYVAYATMGLILSHEMVHSLDLTGLRLDARLECYAKQYAQVFIKHVDFKRTRVRVQFDWNATKSENMADASGLQIAYETWRLSHQGFPDPPLPNLSVNPNQLFFLIAAQMYCTKLSPEDYIMAVETDYHTTAPERVNGMMMNSQHFADTFNCVAGSRMNPSKKCSTY